jgi:hypothetical protein
MPMYQYIIVLAMPEDLNDNKTFKDMSHHGRREEIVSCNLHQGMI